MNKEEIIKYLKEKIKTNQDFIETIEKIDNDSSKTKDDIINNSKNDIKYYKEIINYIEKKDKVIDEAIDYIKNTKNYIFDAKRNKITGELIVNNKIETNTINKIKLLEILERGKNDN